LELNFLASTGTTASTPSLTYTSGSLTDLAGKHLATTTVTASDYAEPRLTGAAYLYDINGNGKVDKIQANFSEIIAAASDTTSWTLNNALLGGAITGASASGASVVLTLSEPTDFNTSTGGMNLSFANNGSWKDTHNNAAGNSASAISLIDQAAPIVVAKSTEDRNANSKIDSIKLTMSEHVASTLS